MRVEGGLTSSQEKVFGADIQMKVFNTQSARILEMCFLLPLITHVIGLSLPLIGRISVRHCEIVSRVASVNAMSRRRQRNGGN